MFQATNKHTLWGSPRLAPKDDRKGRRPLQVPVSEQGHQWSREAPTGGSVTPTESGETPPPCSSKAHGEN